MAETSIFERNIDPLHQAAGVLGLVLVFDVLGSIFAATTNLVSDRWAWLMAASFLLFFAVYNAIMSASAPNILKYWGRSLYCFMGLALAAGLLAWAFSGTSIGDAGSFRWIYIVVTLGYLVFLAMVAVIKQIVEFAQKEEWNQPKMRPRKRRR